MSLTRDKLITYAKANTFVNENEDVFGADCRIVKYLLDNCEITVPEENTFFVDVNSKFICTSVMIDRWDRFNPEIENGRFHDLVNVRAISGFYDFGHTSAEWQSVISLGIYGLKKRIESYAEKCGNDENKLKFYENLISVYDSALGFIKRAAVAAASAGKETMAKGLERLSENSPETMFEAMQTNIVYYVLHQMFDCTVLRTLGRLDSLFYPYFVKETPENAKELVKDYLKEIDRFKAVANIPFALGGTDIHGNSLVNELSYIILDAYDNLRPVDVKMHLLCSENIPSDIIRRAFSCIRNGNNSIVFMSDEKVIESLMKLGIERSDAVDYHVVGCYECGANGELACTCNARVVIPKALEFALNGGHDMLTGELVGLPCKTDFDSFEELYAEFERQLIYLCECAIELTNMYEVHYPKIHSAPIFSAVYTSSLENARDLYCGYGAKYNNSSVNALGIATAVDSLAAIKKAVFEDKMLSLGELTEILSSNWKDKEPLRLLIKNRFPKYGRGDSKTDALATSIAQTLSDSINGKPNVKGGVFRLGLFSINWRWDFGAKTGASADGRLCGEPVSQNSGASLGADKDGATAHLTSVCAIDASNTSNSTIVDIDLHASAVKGENGMNLMTSTLKTYFEKGGFAVHYNVLDVETLKDAKVHPDKYPNLQVRLCGWNVLFNNLSEKEKDEFILRSAK